MQVFGIALRPETVCIFEDAAPKAEVLATLSQRLAEAGLIPDAKAFQEALSQREEIMSTGVGEGVAVPHVRLEGLTAPAMAVGISKAGVEFDTLDNAPVHIVLTIAMPKGKERGCLGALAQAMSAMKSAEVRQQLVNAASPEEALDVLLAAQ